MSVQDVRRARGYFLGFRNEFGNGLYDFDRHGKGVKKAFELSLSFDCLYHLRRVMFDMAKASQQPARGNTEFKGFVNYKLTVEEKEAYAAWDLHDHDLFDLLALDAQQGYKLTVSWNDQNETFTATYMCQDKDSPNYGYCLSSFAPDWYNAVRVTAFKHTEVLKSAWPISSKQKTDDWG